MGGSLSLGEAVVMVEGKGAGRMNGRMQWTDGTEMELLVWAVTSTARIRATSSVPFLRLRRYLFKNNVYGPKAGEAGLLEV
jgi:hypothetical protein